MNNTIYCECAECGNEFAIPVPDLLEADQEEVIGDLVWCGICESHDYECAWGIFSAGDSSCSVAEVLRIWNEWATSHSSPR